MQRPGNVLIANFKLAAMPSVILVLTGKHRKNASLRRRQRSTVLPTRPIMMLQVGRHVLRGSWQ